jgi:GTP-binding protein
VLLLIDARRGPMPADNDAMALLDRAAVSYQLVLTKADALKTPDLANAQNSAQDAAARHPAAHPEIATTSAETGTGIPELRAALTTLTKTR